MNLDRSELLWALAKGADEAFCSKYENVADDSPEWNILIVKDAQERKQWWDMFAKVLNCAAANLAQPSTEFDLISALADLVLTVDPNTETQR
jgi:hypothetical protein